MIRTGTTEHFIQTQPECKGNGIIWYRAVCTCGYHSRRYQYTGGFAPAVRAHLKAKGGAA